MVKDLKDGNVHGEASFGALDILKWCAFGLLLLASLFANSYYELQVAWGIRAAIGIVVVALLLGVAFTTSQGQHAWGFIKSSRSEIRKVVWPTKQETIQTTLMVVVMVLVTAVILWGLDMVFVWLVGLVIGQRG